MEPLTNNHSNLIILFAEFKTMEWYIEFSLLAASGGSSFNKGVHIQCYKSRGLSDGRETEISGSWTICL